LATTNKRYRKMLKVSISAVTIKIYRVCLKKGLETGAMIPMPYFGRRPKPRLARIFGQKMVLKDDGHLPCFHILMGHLFPMPRLIPMVITIELMMQRIGAQKFLSFVLIAVIYGITNRKGSLSTEKNKHPLRFEPAELVCKKLFKFLPKPCKRLSKNSQIVKPLSSLIVGRTRQNMLCGSSSPINKI